MKKLFRKMAALLAGALTAAVLTGCSMFPSQTEQPTATDTVLLMTQGDGMPALNKDEDVEEFLSCVNTTLGGSASLVITDGNPQVIGPVRFDEEKANSVQQEKTDKKKSAEVAEMVKSAAASTPETDLMAISTSTIPTYSLWAAPAPARPGRMQFPMCWKLAVPWSSQIPKEKFCARLAAFSNERDMKYGCSICSTRMRPSAITHSGMCGMTKRCCS